LKSSAAQPCYNIPMNRKWNVTDETLQKKCVDEVITRIEEIDGQVGIIAAQDIIDIVTQNLGPEIYNMGVRDAKKLLQERFHDLEVDVDLLEQKS
jgi:uncharacterized protein (DUF2164 family)